MNNLGVVGGAGPQFDALNKERIVQKLRAAILTNNDNTAYLRIAKDFGWDAADEYEYGEADNWGLDVGTCSRIEKVARRHAYKLKSRTSVRNAPQNNYRFRRPHGCRPCSLPIQQQMFHPQYQPYPSQTYLNFYHQPPLPLLPQVRPSSSSAPRRSGPGPKAASSTPPPPIPGLD